MYNSVVKRDLEKNFFNEFAEKINFSGIRLKAVVSAEEYKRKYAVRSSNDLGFQDEGLVISLKKRDLPSPVKANDMVTVNNKEYIVTGVFESIEITKIVLKTTGE